MKRSSSRSALARLKAAFLSSAETTEEMAAAPP